MWLSKRRRYDRRIRFIISGGGDKFLEIYRLWERLDGEL
jgi:hypothetical protein